MDILAAQALTRYGLGRRGVESLPSDPKAWLLDQVRQARDAGQAVILIMHNLQQALSVADEVIVLARGRVMGQFSSTDADLERVTQLVGQG